MGEKVCGLTPVTIQYHFKKLVTTLNEYILPLPFFEKYYNSKYKVKAIAVWNCAICSLKF